MLLFYVLCFHSQNRLRLRHRNPVWGDNNHKWKPWQRPGESRRGKQSDRLTGWASGRIIRLIWYSAWRSERRRWLSLKLGSAGQSGSGWLGGQPLICRYKLPSSCWIRLDLLSGLDLSVCWLEHACPCGVWRGGTKLNLTEAPKGGSVAVCGRSFNVWLPVWGYRRAAVVVLGCSSIVVVRRFYQLIIKMLFLRSGWFLRNVYFVELVSLS